MGDYVIVTTTAASERDAAALAHGLVAARLVACAQVLGPIRSVYRWEGEVRSEPEWQCVAKTTAALAGEVIEHVVEHHDYATPEVVVTPVVAGHGPYLAWIDEQTGRR